MTGARPPRVVVGVTGATGTVIALAVLRGLGECGVERHLVVSGAGRRTAKLELPDQRIEDHAEHVYGWRDIGAPPASGSYPVDAMIVVPCSVNTLSAVAYGRADNLISRAADVTLKERRRLVLCVRETPLHLGHLRAMQAVTEIGGIIAPPVPAFYIRPGSVEDLVTHTAGRLLGLLGFEPMGVREWRGDGPGQDP
jgi:4-hydroxy-3-polyprenylbenzoate decarboxylase